MSKKPQPKPYKVSWAQAVRDVFIASINRGQLPILTIGGILMLIVWKMPDEDVSKLAFAILESLRNNELWAYILLVLSLICWFIHAKTVRKSVSQEFDRIGKEKSMLQNQASAKVFKSSQSSP